MTHKVTGNGGSNPGNAQVVGTPPSITSNDITKVAGKEWLQFNPSVVEKKLISKIEKIFQLIKIK